MKIRFKENYHLLVKTLSWILNNKNSGLKEIKLKLFKDSKHKKL